MSIKDKKLEPKKGFKHIQDILKEVSEETPFSLKDIEEAWRLHKEHLESLMDDPEVFKIYLPHIGILYYNKVKAKDLYHRQFNKNEEQEIYNKNKRVEELIEKSRKEAEDRGTKTIFRYPQGRKINLLRLYKGILAYLENTTLRKRHANIDKIIKLIEDFSNNRLKKDESDS